MKRILSAAVALGVLLASGVATAHGADATIDAVWDCDGTVTVTSEGHAISNVVIRDASGDTKVEEPFEQIDEDGNAIEVFEYQFEATDGLEGVFVKAGNNGARGRANQGYGEWVPLTAPEDCGPVLGTGDVQVTLRWPGSPESRDDYDVYVIDPDGDKVWYFNKTVPSGGTLDVDAICLAEESVENVFWPEATAPPGEYTVGVDLFNDCADGIEGTWHLTVRVGGVVVIDEIGTGDSDPTLNVAGPENTFTFTYPTP